MEHILQKILQNGQESASISSAITTKAGQTALTTTSNTGKYGMNLTAKMRTAQTLAGRVQMTNL